MIFKFVSRFSLGGQDHLGHPGLPRERVDGRLGQQVDPQVEMMITIVSTGFALGAFVVGIFGMNFQWNDTFMGTDEDMRGRHLFIVTVAPLVT